jgi:hypothetical protein
MVNFASSPPPIFISQSYAYISNKCIQMVNTDWGDEGEKQ